MDLCGKGVAPLSSWLKEFLKLVLSLNFQSEVCEGELGVMCFCGKETVIMYNTLWLQDLGPSAMCWAGILLQEEI